MDALPVPTVLVSVDWIILHIQSYIRTLAQCFFKVSSLSIKR